MSIGVLFFSVNWQSRLVYCRGRSFVFFRTEGQVDQHRHVLNPEADEFIPGFQATRAFQTNVFGKLELRYTSYLISAAHLFI